MPELKEPPSAFAADFETFVGEVSGSGSSFLTAIRKAAMGRFAALGFPSTRQEDWRYTNVAPIAKTTFVRADREEPKATREQIDRATFEAAGVHRVVFVNGRFAECLSTSRTVAGGVKVRSLAQALDDDEPSLKAHLARYADYQENVFTALNTAYVEDGALVHVSKSAVAETPIHLLFLSTAPEHPLVTHPRILIVAEESSQITVIEEHVGLGEDVYFTNAVTEIVAGQNAVVDHYKVGRESERAYHVGLLHVQQNRSSKVTSNAVTLGGGLVRNGIMVLLDGEGCDCTLNGLTLLHGSQHVDNHLRVEHVKPHCHSWEYFKTILDEKSHGVFTGRIYVHKGAQKTDAKQTNMNLLLSEEAIADSKPQLEIFANDVKCTHGATIGQIDKDAIFYLRSRGIDEAAARNLLVYAFASESIASVRVEPLRKQIEALLFERLAKERVNRGGR